MPHDGRGPFLVHHTCMAPWQVLFRSQAAQPCHQPGATCPVTLHSVHPPPPQPLRPGHTHSHAFTHFAPPAENAQPTWPPLYPFIRKIQSMWRRCEHAMPLRAHTRDACIHLQSNACITRMHCTHHGASHHMHTCRPPLHTVSPDICSAHTAATRPPPINTCAALLHSPRVCDARLARSSVQLRRRSHPRPMHHWQLSPLRGGEEA